MTRFYIEGAEEFDRAVGYWTSAMFLTTSMAVTVSWSRIATPLRSLACSSCSTSTTRRYEHAAT